MGTFEHWLETLQKVEQKRIASAVAVARRTFECDQWKSLQQSFAADPLNPANWHRRIVNEELAKPRAAEIYFKICRALWSWEEFAGVSRGALAILRVVIELARDEAFPWYVAVPAEQVRRLARMSTRHYIRSIQELDGLAITRPARILQVVRSDGMPQFPGTIDQNDPCEPIAQFVVRYRRGIPWNKKAAAWWINYDLLGQMRQVHRCFIVTPRTLSKTYRSRNGRMGPPPPDWALTERAMNPDGFAALEESLSKAGPVPPAGLRAALWSPSLSANPQAAARSRSRLRALH